MESTIIWMATSFLAFITAMMTIGAMFNTLTANTSRRVSYYFVILAAVAFFFLLYALIHLIPADDINDKIEAIFHASLLLFVLYDIYLWG